MRLHFPFMIRRVHGHSMVPTLPPGTLVIARRWFRGIKPGKVVVLKHEKREMIKRIKSIDSNGIYVLGDHPETSTDSRQFGYISRDQIVAILLWPRSHYR